jgi:primosomal protein N'
MSDGEAAAPAASARQTATPVWQARLAVPAPLGQAFSYLVPPELRARVQRGARVLCELGKRKVLGIVLEAGERVPDIAVERMKPIVAVVDAEPVLPEELLSFLQELARYYVAPIGGAIELSLPAVERTAAELLKATQTELGKVPAKVVGRWVTFVTLAPQQPLASVPRGKAQQVLDALAQGDLPAADLEKRVPGARAAVKRLVELGFVLLEKREPAPDAPWGTEVVPDVPPELNLEQARAVTAITARLEAGERAQFLLEGVTASGKTEVYLRAAKRALELGKSAIVLVPEIALTPQLVARFRARLGDQIAVMHSALSDAERHRMWRGLRSGELRIAVGARSALFAPVSDLGLICVDEEHDGSFKQEEGVRYHARDMALLRAHRAGAVCVLGSATPSLASVALVREGRLQHLSLPARARAASILPSVEIVDIRRVGPSGDFVPESARLCPELGVRVVRAHRAVSTLLRQLDATPRAALRDGLSLLRLHDAHPRALRKVQRRRAGRGGRRHRAHRDLAGPALPRSAHRAARSRRGGRHQEREGADAHARRRDRYLGRHANGHQGSRLAECHAGRCLERRRRAVDARLSRRRAQLPLAGAGGWARRAR